MLCKGQDHAHIHTGKRGFRGLPTGPCHHPLPYVESPKFEPPCTPVTYSQPARPGNSPPRRPMPTQPLRFQGKHPMPTVGQTDGQMGIQPGLFNWGLGRSRAQSPGVEHLGHVPCTLLYSPPDPPLSGRLPAWTTGPSSLTATLSSEK